MKLAIEFTQDTVVAAKAHVCDYCDKAIAPKTKYHKFTSRLLKKERFPVTLKVCNQHQPGLIPISFLRNRKK